jgi:hypothetical protein
MGDCCCTWMTGYFRMEGAPLSLTEALRLLLLFEEAAGESTSFIRSAFLYLIVCDC